jgi:hypothetical protein
MRPGADAIRAPLRYLGHGLAGVLIGAALAGACSASDSGAGGTGASSSSGSGGAAGSDTGNDAAGGTTATGGADGGGSGGSGALNLDGSVKDGNIDPDAACDLQKYEATITKKPVDVIFVVDNSCSMSEEILAIQNNINTNFAQIIASSGLDFRVIMISEYGPYTPDDSICIGTPLGGAPCTGVVKDTPPHINPPIFYHYDHDDIESWDSWCKMMTWYDQSDRYKLAPGGWKDWLRPEAFKTFVEVTDDYTSCSMTPFTYSDSNNPSTAQTSAQKFDSDLLALDPTQFGTAQERNYVWHSIVGIGANPSNPTGAYEPTDPITSTECSTAVAPGMAYQALSILTGGLRFPVCNGTGFDVVFQKIAEGVIKGAKIECQFPMPAPPANKELDPKTITIEYTPGDGSGLQTFVQVADQGACKPGAFYIDTANAELVLCPDTCSKVQDDNEAKIQILALCKSGGPA